MVINTSKFGPFKSLQRIGRGGQANIYLGYLSINEYGVHPLIFKKFNNKNHYHVEKDMLRTLDYHKNIIKLVDCGEYIPDNLNKKTADVLVFKQYNMGDGADFSDEYSHDSISKTCVNVDNYISPLWEAIAHAHSKGITHRDIKPENILIHKTKKEKLSIALADWALSSKRSNLYGRRGSWSYIAPEVAQSKQGEVYNYKCDIWSAGATWFAMCYSNDLLNYTDGAMIRELGYSHIKNKHSYVWNQLSDKTQKILEASLVVNPKDRADAHEIVAIAQA